MYSYKGRIRFSETDRDLKLSAVGMIDYLQDAAIFEAEDGKITMDYLEERHLAWLLGSWQVVINRMPRLGECIEIITIPYEFRSFLGNRNFYVKTQAGEILAYANSIWSLTDMEKLRPVRPTEELLSGYEVGEKIDMDYKPRKIKLEDYIGERDTILVGAHQLDSNRHMNNAEYVNIAMSYLPNASTIKEIRVEYKTPAYLHDTMIPVLYGSENRMQVKLQNKEETVYAVVEFSYEKQTEGDGSHE